jgi:hypothetical protein
MAKPSIRVGQVWQSEKDGTPYLVTRLYSEALATIVVLRPTEESSGQPVRVKVNNAAAGQSIPGFKPARSSED